MVPRLPAYRVPRDVPHFYASCGLAAARFSLAVYEPGVGAACRHEAGDA